MALMSFILLQEEPQNENIDRPQIDMAAAFDRFRGKPGKSAGRFFIFMIV